MSSDIKFLSWKHENKWMESMSGKRWESMIEKENSTYLKEVEKVASEDELLIKQNEFAQSYGTMYFSYNDIVIKVKGHTDLSWFYSSIQNKIYDVADIDIYNSHIYHAIDVGNGSLNYTVQCIKDKIIWTKNNVGPQVYVNNNICYVLGVENLLTYNSLIALDPIKGKVIEVLYKEHEEQYTLRIVKGENDCLFLISEKSGMQKLFLIDGLNILKIKTKGNSFYPIGYYKKNVCYLENIDNVWKPVGFTFRDVHYNIEYFSLKHKILITREYGLQKIFNLKFKKLFSFYGSLHLHPLIHRSDLQKFFINFTDSGIQE